MILEYSGCLLLSYLFFSIFVFFLISVLENLNHVMVPCQRVVGVSRRRETLPLHFLRWDLMWSALITFPQLLHRWLLFLAMYHFKGDKNSWKKEKNWCLRFTERRKKWSEKSEKWDKLRFKIYVFHLFKKMWIRQFEKYLAMNIKITEKSSKISKLCDSLRYY